MLSPKLPDLLWQLSHSARPSHRCKPLRATLVINRKGMRMLRWHYFPLLHRQNRARPNLRNCIYPTIPLPHHPIASGKSTNSLITLQWPAGCLPSSFPHNLPTWGALLLLSTCGHAAPVPMPPGSELYQDHFKQPGTTYSLVAGASYTLIVVPYQSSLDYIVAGGLTGRGFSRKGLILNQGSVSLSRSNHQPTPTSVVLKHAPALVQPASACRTENGF